MSITPRLDTLINDCLKYRAAREAQSLASDLKHLRKTIQSLEGVNEIAARHRGLIDVVKAAFAVTACGHSFPQRLLSAGLAPEYQQRKETRQISALSNYWRACRYLCDVARRYRTLFSSCVINFIDAPTVEKWPPSSSRKHFTHAEIQLLIHHEQLGENSAPLFIGVSKKACFLCHHFIQAHGKYRVVGVHGEVHSQWTIPENPGYTEAFRKSLQHALQIVSTEVSSALRRAKQFKQRNGPQVQSAVNSVIESISTASASTIRADLAVPETDGNGSFVPLSRSQKPLRKESIAEDGSTASLVRELDGRSSLSDRKNLSSCTDVHDDVGRLVNFNQCVLKMGVPRVLRHDWLELFIEVEERSPDDPAPPNPEQVLCRIMSKDGEDTPEDQTVVDVSKLLDGQAVTLSRHPSRSLFSLLFTASDRRSVTAEFFRERTGDHQERVSRQKP